MHPSIISETHYRDANEGPIGSILWLHGIADTVDIESLLPSWILNGMNLIMPKARARRLSAYQNRVLRAWYDVSGWVSKDLKLREIEAAKREIEHLIQQELDKGIPAENIILMGFSQGAAMAMTTALSSKYPLGGVACLSGYWIETEPHSTKINTHPSIFIGHGSLDQTTPLAWCDYLRNRLAVLGVRCEVSIGEFNHRVDKLNFSHMLQWVGSLLNKLKSEN